MQTTLSTSMQSPFARPSPLAKRIKRPVARSASNYPPKFWDNLSKIWLTPRALREIDRRNDARPPATIPTTLAAVTATTVPQFARHGGPDLCYLRGCPEPSHFAQMSSKRPSATSYEGTPSKKVKLSSAYDKVFEQNLIDHDIFPPGYPYTDDASIPEPSNLDEIAQALSVPRASLSPSRFDRSAFRDFARKNDLAISKSSVMRKIIPTILGNPDIPSEGNLHFNNLNSITGGTTLAAVPDLYDGSYQRDISETVRQDLNKIIMPTSHALAPAAPNFFVEVKSPHGGADVAKRQACLDGAIGARAMHSLHRYMEDGTVYHGNAHSFSSIYHAGTGTLQLYAHHITAPTANENLPEYHMTQINSFAMTGDIDSFIRGATAFRNARDLAQRHRETLIQAANDKARLGITAGIR